MTRTAPIWIAFLSLAPLYGQAMVEFGSLSGVSAAAGAQANAVGQSLSGILANSLKNLPAEPQGGYRMQGIPSPYFRMPVQRTPMRAARRAPANFPGPDGDASANPGANPGANQFMQAWMNAMTGGMSGGTFSSSEVTMVSPDKMATPKSSSRTYEDPSLIQPGLGYDQLIDRFGPPLMELTTGPGMKSLMYANLDGSTRTIELQDDKVAVPAAPAPRPKAKPAEPRNYVPMTIR